MRKSEMTCDCDVIHQKIVDEVSENMPREEKIDILADFFKVFGDRTRIKIMWALDKREMCVCDIATLLNMTKSAVSHQLGLLRSNNLVTTRREGKNVYYSMADDHVKQIFEKAVEHIEEKE